MITQRAGSARSKRVAKRKAYYSVGNAARFEKCASMKEFYAKPGYDELRRRMIEEITRRKTECSES